MNQILKFVRQPLNQAAIATLGGMVWTVLQGSTSWQTAAPVLAAAVFALIIPDNSVGKADVEALVKDVIRVAQDFRKTPPAPPAPKA